MQLYLFLVSLSDAIKLFAHFEFFAPNHSWHSLPLIFQECCAFELIWRCCTFSLFLSHSLLSLSSLTSLSHLSISVLLGFFFNTHDELNGFIKYGVFEFQRTVGYNDYLSKEYGANFHLSVQYRSDILKSHNFNNNTNKTTLIWWILL